MTNMVAMETETLESLIGSLSSSSSSSTSRTSKPGSYGVPSTIQIYQIGLVLFNLDDEGLREELKGSFENLLRGIPNPFLSKVLLSELTTAYSAIVNDENDDDDDDGGGDDGGSSREEQIRASRSMCGIYEENEYACRAGYSNELCESLSVAYQRISGGGAGNAGEERRLSRAILRTLSSLLILGLIQNDSDEDDKDDDDDDDTKNDDEEWLLRNVMVVIKCLTVDEKNTCLGDLQELQNEELHPSRSLSAVLQSKLPQSPQRDYLMMMLETSPKRSGGSLESAGKSNTQERRRDHGDDFDAKTAPSSAGGRTKATKERPVDPRTELRRRIQEVRTVLPHLGDGYIEAALSFFQNDVARTVSTLMEADAAGGHNSLLLPAALRVLDPALPARKLDGAQSLHDDDAKDDEAHQINKERIRALQKREEEEAYAYSVVATNEYDDDYDDQYDDIDGGEAVGGRDSGLYDVDIDTIKTYNRMARDAEADDKFWDANRNRNREQNHSRKGGPNKGGASDAADDEEQQPRKSSFGPDKIKGGRVLGPDGKVLPRRPARGRGGGKNGGPQKATPSGPDSQQETSSGNTISKIQRRRKNDNKAKIGNHHRKERAQKKAAAGM